MAELSPDSAESSRPGMLSPLEKACLRWLLRGRTIDEMVVLVGRSKHEIETCIANAVKAVGATSIENALHILATRKRRDL
ncbi:hypothetical protein EXN23_19000 [Agrobacterium salinitolerans]|uniref:LuxR family transcriptional regulator n=2 Tax=Rhizobium/Agrobacterium group TaxID=227290 RepID=A0A546X6J8_RHIRH|nr:hypothetical protein EXN23_19000 [Agrobacterium salinitolerans]TRA96375.1 hypothetical protein EXN68_24790 [Rhizobium rhizogenes]